MNFLVILFAVLTVFASLSWNVDCAPSFQSSSTFTSVTNNGPAITYTVTNNNGQMYYTINGQPATEKDIHDLIGQGDDSTYGSDEMYPPGMNMDMGPVGDMGM